MSAVFPKNVTVQELLFISAFFFWNSCCALRRTMRTKSPFAFTLGLLTFCAISITTNAQQLRDAFRQVNQSVVIVRTKRVEVAPSADEPMAVIDGLGSGVLISNDGKILTAAHVVQTADIASVEFADGQEITGRHITVDVHEEGFRGLTACGHR